MAKMGEKHWKKYDTLEYFECVGDDLESTFPKMAKAKEGETIVFAFVVYKSKAERDKINKKVMQDMAMSNPAMKDKPMPFDRKRRPMAGSGSSSGASDPEIPLTFHPARDSLFLRIKTC